VTVIPISEAMHAPRRMFHAPIAVLNGMVRLFFALMLVETVALALQYL
jgi:phospholipid/cholesterol/gamma-HCH transport system permease protein